MRTFAVLISLAFLLGALVVLSSCGGDEYDQATRPLSEDDGTYAKDRERAQACDQLDLKLADCFDTCNCCSFEIEGPSDTDHNNLNQCIWYCDGLLLKINDIEHSTKADITNYKECIIGCFSICDKPNKETTCYNECAHYLGE